MSIPYPARIGADWMTVDDENYFTLPGLVYGHWNGWTVPGFARAEAEQYTRFDNWMVASYGDAPRFSWEGDTLVYTGTPECDFEDAEHIKPNVAGHYLIGDGWTWDEETDEPLECWIILTEFSDGKRGRYAGWFSSEEEARGHLPSDPVDYTYQIVRTA